MPTPTTWAPAPGADPEFDELAKRVTTTLDEAGWDTPESAPINELAAEKGISREEAAAAILADRLARFGGKTFTGSPSGPPDDTAEPEVEVPITETDLVIPTKGDAYWYEDPADAKLLDHVILTRRAIGAAFHGGLVITGHAGFGKTMSVVHAIKRINRERNLDLRLTRIDCATTTDEQKWFGRREADSKGTRYVPSDLVEAVERGDVILLDDLSRIHARIANPLFGFLDGSQSVHLSDLNVTVNVHPNTFFIATMNQGAQYGGTHRLDWAWRRRFPFTIEKGPPPRDEEIRVLTSVTNCDVDGAATLVDMAIKSRQMFENGDLRNPISTGALVSAAWLVASGMTEKEAARYSIIPLFDGDSNGVAGEESDRQKVSGILSMKTGR